MTRETWSEVGALTSAGSVAATVFCCLPFATGVLGANVAALGVRLAPFQRYLTGASLVLLGYSFYQAYRPDPSCAEGRCGVSSAARARRAMAWFVAVLVVVLLTTSWWADQVIYWTL